MSRVSSAQFAPFLIPQDEKMDVLLERFVVLVMILAFDRTFFVGSDWGWGGDE